MKTVKTYSKRIKITKTGKLITRKSGHNHYNAKENTKSKMRKGRNFIFKMTNKEKSKFLVNIK